MNYLHSYKTVLTIEAYSWLMVHEKQYLMTNKAYVILKRVVYYLKNDNHTTIVIFFNIVSDDNLLI